MGSFERRVFGLRLGAESDAVQALLAFRDAARKPKNQVQAIEEIETLPVSYDTGFGVFYALTALKSSPDAHGIALRYSPCQMRKIRPFKLLPARQDTL